MKKCSNKKIMLISIVLIMILALFQNVSYCSNQGVQTIQKNQEEYMIYLSDLINKEFEFAFSDDKNADKTTLTFYDSAVDKVENGNHIAYIDKALYNSLFKDDSNSYLWVRQNDKYLIEGEKLNINNALTENEIQTINKLTKTIKTEMGEKELPKEVKENGEEYQRKIGTLIIKDNENAKYSYILMKSTPDSNVEKFIKLAEKTNGIDSENTYEKISIYKEINSIYKEIKPSIDNEKWVEVNNLTIEQPIESKKNEQYLVWIKQDIDENNQKMDMKIMTCNENEKEIKEERKEQVKEVVKLPITGDSIVLFVIAGVIIALIIIFAILKIRNNKKN